MRDARAQAPRTAVAPPPLLPTLHEITGSIRDELAARGQLGLISVSVLQKHHHDRLEHWPWYDSLLDEMTSFLHAYLRRRLRSTDRLLGASSNGNGFVILLDRPRHERELDPTDLARVRLRLRSGLRAHLRRRLDEHALASFGCYVGAALMRHRPDVPIERVVYRALESALADALRERERDDRSDVVNLHRVLEAGQIRSVYQPVVDLIDRRVLGFEALSRTPPARFGNVEELFRVAQEHRALWRLERLCRERALEDRPDLSAGQVLFLNVEPDSLNDPDLTGVAFVERLERAGLRPDQVVLEMTEHSAIRDFAAIRNTLARFRDRGFRLAMDDVGSGYSGLQAIAEIAPEFIKVDMSLVRDVHRHPIKNELITTIRRFSDSTGVTLIAEGVESPEELDALVTSGVRCAQGFLFARPDTPPGVPDWSRVRSGGPA